MDIVVVHLRILDSLILVSTCWGVFLLRITPFPLVVGIFFLPLLPVVVRLIRGIDCNQLFKVLNLWSRGWLNIIYPCLLLFVWWGSRLRRTIEGIVRVTLRRGSVLIVQCGCYSTINRVV
jgi:hypothetical protein